MASNVISYLRLPVIASSIVAAAGSTLLYFKQNELIYPRNIPLGSRTPEGVPSPSTFGIHEFEEISISTPDGETLAGYLIRPNCSRNPDVTPPKPPDLTILMFHGNAGNIGHRAPIARVLDRKSGYRAYIVMVEYRGYGLSTGTPQEDGLKIDAQAALDWIRSREETRNTRIVVFGQSLGGAVATSLVARNQGAGDIAAMILENTFLSIRKMIPSAFPPARYLAPLCHQRWASEEVLPQITEIPILFLSGLKDEIVPAVNCLTNFYALRRGSDCSRPTQMRELFELCRARVKIWRELPDGCHNDSVGEPGYFDYIAAFIKEYVPRSLDKG